jgi:hypothetical protein
MKFYVREGQRDYTGVKACAHRIGQKHRVTVECMPGAPAQLAESLAGHASCSGAAVPRLKIVAPIAKSGVYGVISSRGPGKVHCVISDRARHLECTGSGFRWGEECKHVREVRKAAFDAERRAP